MFPFYFDLALDLFQVFTVLRGGFRERQQKQSAYREAKCTVKAVGFRSPHVACPPP